MIQWKLWLETWTTEPVIGMSRISEWLAYQRVDFAGMAVTGANDNTATCVADVGDMLDRPNGGSNHTPGQVEGADQRGLVPCSDGDEMDMCVDQRSE